MNSNALLRKGLGLIYLSFFPFSCGQTTNNIPGTWVENNPGGTGCPALTIRPDDTPIVVAAQPVDVAGPSIFSTYYFYQWAFLNNEVIQNKWVAISPPLNLNPFERMSNISLSVSSAEQPSNASFTSWVETRNRYQETSLVAANMDNYKNNDLLARHLFQVDATKDAFAQSSALDKQGRPLIAWNEGHADDYLYEDYVNPVTFIDTTSYRNTQIYVRHWNGEIWEEVGTPLDGFRPRIALDHQDVPYMSYFKNMDAGNKVEVVTVHWDGKSWQQLGQSFEVIPSVQSIQYASGALSRTHLTAQVELVLDKGGLPIVTWIADDPTSGMPKLFLKKWDGNAWNDVGEDSAVTVGNFPRDFAVAYRAGKLALAVSETSIPQPTQSAPVSLYVREWDGKAWRLLGNSALENAGPICPVLALDSKGTAFVAWNQPFVNRTITSSQIMLRYFVRD